MNAQSASDIIDQDRRQLLSGAAMGIIAAGAANLMSVSRASGATESEIRPFHHRREARHRPESGLVQSRSRSAAEASGAGGLAVEPQEVVLGQTEPADRRLRFYTTMGPVPVVLMQPGRQLLGATV